MGVFYAAVKASPRKGLNIEIGGRGGVPFTSCSRMGVFNADTGIDANLYAGTTTAEVLVHAHLLMYAQQLDKYAW